MTTMQPTWREERRRDRMADAQIARETAAARVQDGVVQAEARAKMQAKERQVREAERAAARKQRAAEEANKPKAPTIDGPKVDLAIRNDANAYWLDPARKADHPADPFHAQRKPWVPRPLKELAAEVGKTITDEEISRLPNNPPDLWKKLKAS